MTVRLIFARSANGYIGRNGDLLFSIPEDKAVFKMKTANSTVIMGRRTWESIPEKFRPLPGRRNIVLSKMLDRDACQGAEVMRSLAEALSSHAGEGPHWVIGGESLYNEAMAYADEIHETVVTKAFEGDVRAPTIDNAYWTRVSSSPFKIHDELMYQFNVYMRNDHGNQAQESGQAATLGQIRPVGEQVRQSAGRGQTPYVQYLDDAAFYRQPLKGGACEGAVQEEQQRRLCEGAGGCQGVCGQDGQARCAKAAGQAGLEER